MVFTVMAGDNVNELTQYLAPLNTAGSALTSASAIAIESALQFRLQRLPPAVVIPRVAHGGHRWRGRTLDHGQLEEAGRPYEASVNLIAVGERFDVDRRYIRVVLPQAAFTLRKSGPQKRQS